MSLLPWYSYHLFSIYTNYCTRSLENSFFYHLKVALRYGSHQSWEDFIVFVRGEEPDG
jgi:hypothetical protein